MVRFGDRWWVFVCASLACLTVLFLLLPTEIRECYLPPFKSQDAQDPSSGQAPKQPTSGFAGTGLDACTIASSGASEELKELTDERHYQAIMLTFYTAILNILLAIFSILMKVVSHYEREKSERSKTAGRD